MEEGIYPEYIKSLSKHDMELLCGDIRKKIISTLSNTGGHLASNLGIVELTLAIHKVFDAPKDKIVWDVGHQSYVHKLITGRGNSFDTLRQMNGMSGFPKRSESEYDTFDTGHSSNSISAALGMAVARDLKGEDYSVVAVIGDGALTGGMVYEAMNNAGVMDSNLIVILNDNEMSISKDYGSMSQHLGKLRTSDSYDNVKKKIKRAVKNIPGVGGALYNGLESMRDALKYLVVPGVLFEEMGFVYLGPVDGHNLEGLIEVLTNAKSMEKPVLVHCITQKGKGYAPAEKRPDKFHGVSPFDKKTGVSLSKSDKLTYSAVFGRKLTEIAKEDARIVAVSAAMIDGTGLSEFARTFPERIFDVGIAEEHAVTFAAGMAVNGMKPVVAIYSTFLQRSYDQIMIDVCMQNLPVVFCIDRAGIVGADGETHHGIYDLSYLQSMPNMTILAPSDGPELEIMLKYALTMNGPCAVRYPRGSAEDLSNYRIEETAENKILQTVDSKSCEGKIAQIKPIIMQRGSDITIAAVGKMTSYCLKAAKKLNESGIQAEVIDARIIKPLDEESSSVYINSAERTGRILVVEDNIKFGGFGSLIESLFAADSEVKAYKIGWPDEFVQHGTQEQLEKKFGLDPDSIAEKVSEIIEGKA
ncbi:MAG: 1-deoxy-D-xylulose-5-phosphate synthase [Firmicutes bacterium]|nr:1-deoxy-D-xylulose-5-phosphate synthase [Bacillota bacterium]